MKTVRFLVADQFVEIGVGCAQMPHDRLLLPGLPDPVNGDRWQKV